MGSTAACMPLFCPLRGRLCILCTCACYFCTREPTCASMPPQLDLHRHITFARTTGGPQWVYHGATRGMHVT